MTPSLVLLPPLLGLPMSMLAGHPCPPLPMPMIPAAPGRGKATPEQAERMIDFARTLLTEPATPKPKLKGKR